MNVLIAGCGDVGNVLATSLLKKHHIVYGLKRNVSSLPAGVQAIQADLTDPASLLSLPEDIDALVFMPTPASRDPEGYESIFHQGWKNLWTSLKNQPKRTLLVSSTAVYGQSDGSDVNEATVAEPARFNGRALLRMEQLAAECTDKLIVARVAGIYGPGREGMIRLAATQDLEVQKFPPMFTNRMHRDDVAAALMHLLLLPDPQNLYLLSDNLSEPKYDVLAWIASKLRKPAPTGLELAVGASGKRVSNQRLRRSGFELNFPDYRTGYGAILEHRYANEFTK